MALASDPITAAAGANDAVTGIAGVVADPQAVDQPPAQAKASNTASADDAHKVSRVLLLACDKVTRPVQSSADTCSLPTVSIAI